MSSTTRKPQEARPRRSRKGRVTFAKVRSVISNGSRLFLPGVDERDPWVRRLRDLIGDHLADLGGVDAISEAEKVLVRRAAMLTLQCELMEQGWANDGGVASAKSLDLYSRTAGQVRRILESLGLERRAVDVTPQPNPNRVLNKLIDAVRAAP